VLPHPLCCRGPSSPHKTTPLLRPQRHQIRRWRAHSLPCGNHWPAIQPCCRDAAPAEIVMPRDVAEATAGMEGYHACRAPAEAYQGASRGPSCLRRRHQSTSLWLSPSPSRWYETSLRVRWSHIEVQRQRQTVNLPRQDHGPAYAQKLFDEMPQHIFFQVHAWRGMVMQEMAV